MKFIEDVYRQFDRLPDTIRSCLMALSVFGLAYSLYLLNPEKIITYSIVIFGVGAIIIDIVLMKVGRDVFYNTKVETRTSKFSVISKFIIFGLFVFLMIFYPSLYILTAYVSYELFKFTSYSQYVRVSE